MPLPRFKPTRTKKPRIPKANAWVRLQGLEDIGDSWCEGEIINLPGWKTIKYKETDHDIIILAEATTAIEGTCACGETAAKFKFWGYTAPTYVRDLPVRDKRTRIYYRLQRKRCNNASCGKRKTIQQPLADIAERHSLTARLLEYIERESFNIFRSFSDIASETGVHELTVRKIFTRRAAQLEGKACKLRKEGRYEPPEWLGIDEVHLPKEVEYCVISAPAHQQVVEILPVNQERELFKWLLQLPNPHRVKVVTIDMWLEYRNLIARFLPNARIVVDRYHVHNLLNVALKEVLDVLRASQTYTENREHMRSEHLLLMSYRKLSKEQLENEHGIKQPSPKEVADKWLADMPDLAWAHRLKEDFSDILQLTDREKAEELTELWLPQVCDFVDYFRGKYERNHKDEWPDPFGNVPHTITRWRNSILNYIDCKDMFSAKTVSNSFAEFANGRIKRAYLVGYYSFEVLRLKVIYGGVLVKQHPPHPLDVPRLRVVRKRGRQLDKKKRGEANPDANLAVLRRAREEADETRGLLPRPQEQPGFMSRFNLAEMAEVRRKVVAQEPPAEEIKAPVTNETAQTSSTNERCKRRIKYNPDQKKLF